MILLQQMEKERVVANRWTDAMASVEIDNRECATIASNAPAVQNDEAYPPKKWEYRRHCWV
jgi:hypothetical protein